MTDWVQKWMARQVETAQKYDPNQPRVPEGSAGGGRWTSGALSEATIPDADARWKDEETIVGNAIIDLPSGTDVDSVSDEELGHYITNQLGDPSSIFGANGAIMLEGPEDIDEIHLSQVERSGAGYISLKFEAIVSDEAMERREQQVGTESEWEVDTGVEAGLGW